jgi:hypothetical protein
MLPSAGQGACQAFEDAYILGRWLKERRDPMEAFANYDMPTGFNLRQGQLIPQQQLLIHRPGDVGQDTCPLHQPPLPADPRWPPVIAPKDLADDTRRDYAKWDNSPTFLQF